MSGHLGSGAVARHLWVGPNHDGLWIVRDAAAVCGAIFLGREEALRFAKRECETAPPGQSDWRFVAALDLTSLFAPPEQQPR